MRRAAALALVALLASPAALAAEVCTRFVDRIVIDFTANNFASFTSIQGSNLGTIRDATLAEVEPYTQRYRILATDVGAATKVCAEWVTLQDAMASMPNLPPPGYSTEEALAYWGGGFTFPIMLWATCYGIGLIVRAVKEG